MSSDAVSKYFEEEKKKEQDYVTYGFGAFVLLVFLKLATEYFSWTRNFKIRESEMALQAEKYRLFAARARGGQVGMMNGSNKK